MAEKPKPDSKPDSAGGVEFFAPVRSGYVKTDDAPTGAAMPPPPPGRPMPPLQQAAPAPAPPPKVTVSAKPTKPMDMSSPKDASKALADTMVQSFVERMKAAAQAKGGHLSVADLENMQSEFDHQAKALSGALEQSFEAYVKARERSVWDQERNFPFDRLMVKKFSKLFRDGEALTPDGLHRRMLPGFFVALGMMLGPEVVEQNQEKLRTVVKRVKDQGKSVFNWDDVYADITAIGVSLTTEVAIAQHFDEFDKRANWFINMVNGHLAPVDADAHPNVVRWELTNKGFMPFLGGLLSDLRAQLQTDNGKMALTKRFGGDTVASLFDILKKTGS